MRSSLPIFIFVGLALVIAIGVAVLEVSTGSAISEVGNSTTEELPITLFGAEYAIMFGLAALLFILGAYFALKSIIK